jgi:Holliday junction resolvase RusA-like endonuclease
MQFTLTKPPTTNHIYGITARGGFAQMYITKEGKEWIAENTLLIKSQWKKKTPITQDCEIWIIVYTSTKRDADGSTKPIMDIFQKVGVVENDYLFSRVHAIREKVAKGEDKVVVDINEF